MLELPTPLCPACLFVFARELLPAFGPIAASSSFTCHRLTRMATNKDAFLKLQGEAQKADHESLRRPRPTDFWSPHCVKATARSLRPHSSACSACRTQGGLGSGTLLPGLAALLDQKSWNCERGWGGAPRPREMLQRFPDRSLFLDAGGVWGIGLSTPRLPSLDLWGFCLVSSCFGLGVMVTAPSTPRVTSRFQPTLFRAAFFAPPAWLVVWRSFLLSVGLCLFPW